MYAGQRHSLKLPNGETAGFLLGDGAGMGKGRQIAGEPVRERVPGRFTQRSRTHPCSTSTQYKYQARTRTLAHDSSSIYEQRCTRDARAVAVLSN